MTIEQAARNFFAWFNRHYPAPSIHPDHEWNRLGLALAEQTVPSDCADSHQPVAWYFEARHIDSAWAAAVTMKHPGPEGKYLRKVTPLYAAPPKAEPKPMHPELRKMWEEYFDKCFRAMPVPQREPLTREEIMDLCASQWAAHPVEVARLIERAHGIGGQE